MLIYSCHAFNCHRAFTFCTERDGVVGDGVGGAGVKESQNSYVTPGHFKPKRTKKLTIFFFFFFNLNYICS